jgi:hypothetical protein
LGKLSGLDEKVHASWAAPEDLLEDRTPATQLELTGGPPVPPLWRGVDDQRLQHVIPAGALAAGRQTPALEVFQPELLVENIGQPAGTPLARAAQLQLMQTDADDVVVLDCGRTFLGKEATVRARVEPVSKTAIVWCRAACSEELISPK